VVAGVVGASIVVRSRPAGRFDETCLVGGLAGVVSGLVLVGAGSVLAYLGSEAVKLAVDEERPCRALGEPQTWVPCPPTGDWSFPSNHATVAGALAAGVIMLAPRLARVAVPAALAVAVLRVVAGVHYPHDVLAGLLFGAAVTVSVMVLLTAPTTLVVERFRRLATAHDDPTARR